VISQHGGAALLSQPIQQVADDTSACNSTRNDVLNTTPHTQPLGRDRRSELAAQVVPDISTARACSSVVLYLCHEL
jgi:hypothetical protein